MCIRDRVKAALTRRGHLDAEGTEALNREADALAVRVRDGCRALPEPDPVAVAEHVYAAMDPDLRAQQQDIAQLLAIADEPGPPGQEDAR